MVQISLKKEIDWKFQSSIIKLNKFSKNNIFDLMKNGINKHAKNSDRTSKKLKSSNELT